MTTGTVSVTDRSLGTISPLVFGGMIEHFGRTVYPGVWDVERDGVRADTREAAARMGVRLLRYPGGCFSCDYHWRDGVGPRSERPTVAETFWTGLPHRMAGFGADSQLASGAEALGRLIGPAETNAFGTDEFLQYCLDIDAEPFLVVNIGTGTPEEAADWVRYCNVDRKSPRTVTWWSIGNETWGSHEYGHDTPSAYGERVAEFARAMRLVDPAIKLVAVGLPVSDGTEIMASGEEGLGLTTYAAREWNSGVLKACGDVIDLLSVHWYFPGMIGRALDNENDLLQLNTSPDQLAEILRDTAAFNDEMVPGRDIGLSLDEWNRMVQFDDHLSTNHPLGNAAFFAGCYNALLANAERAPIAVISHLVNCLAPIQTDDDRLFGTAAFLVAQLYEAHARGTSLAVDVEAAAIDVPPLDRLAPDAMTLGDVSSPRQAPVLSASATRHGDETSVFLVNRSVAEAAEVSVLGAADGEAIVRWIDGPDLWAVNTLDAPETLTVREKRVVVAQGRVVVTVPPCGVAVLTR
ncbi:alpha-L-arabinofuranosidase C-terminal domain-containing protein [Acrocarpospora pleiomorpha]|uniref:alpha-L-arabinofuranosidase C-terminal domain-containing protein n=1 Tax=Acrocarpospora pleiomorpha TaxID=90975 RepID=UPI0012D2FAB8|nr:alpha-L-arabinofuranosidase C-terminal domain-containing protein [Acrocarpospora pleiomorpha]